MSNHSKHLNEVKALLSNAVYARLQEYMKLKGIESDSVALVQLAEMVLLGCCEPILKAQDEQE